MLTWLVGLPIWLGGVLLADKYVKTDINRNSISFNKLILLRLIVWGLAIICSTLRFHANVSYVYSLPVFAILVYYWLWHEIVYYKDKKENNVLAYGGIMSYSFYLMHTVVITGIRKSFDIEILSPALCLLAILGSLVVSWIFFLIIERPSHKTAKRLNFKNSVIAK